MKVLLLTDTPPSNSNGLGCMLRQLVNFLPRESLACFVIAEPSSEIRIDPELEGIPIQYVTKPFEIVPARLRRFINYIRRRCYSIFNYPTKILKDIKVFIESQKVDTIWFVLQGQTSSPLALKISEGLNLPLYIQVFEPNNSVAHAKSKYSLSHLFTSRRLKNTLQSARACAVSSWALEEHYKREYQINTFPIVHGLSASLCLQPAEKPYVRDTFMIGVTGNLYSHSEWLFLMHTLDYCKWKIGNKNIKIRYIGPDVYIVGRGSNVEYLGWRNQEETISLLSETDVLYCPCSFKKEDEHKVRYGFPPEISFYLAAGRPVFFHGPDYSSAAKFLQKYEAGVFAFDMQKVSLYNCLEHLMWDDKLYKKLTENGHRAFIENLTLENLRVQFEKFLDIQNMR